MSFDGGNEGGASGAVVPGADVSFGVGGLATADLGTGGPAGLMRVAVQGDGSYVAIGATNESIFVVRVRPDGTVDSSFGSKGIVQIPGGLPSNGFAPAHDIAVQPDGKIVGVGRVPFSFRPQGGQPGMAGVIFRLLPNGALDPSFSNGGYAVQAPGIVVSVGLQSTGALLVGGYFQGGNVARYTPSGAIDASFGTAGYITLATNVWALSVDSDDSFLAAGGNVLAHLLSNGAPDGAFGTSGVVTVGKANVDGVSGVSRQQDGNILVAGSFTGANSQPSFGVGRYDSTGNLDTTFGTSGFTYDPNSSLATYAWSVHQAADGRIYASGSGGNQDPLLVMSALGAVQSKPSITSLFGGVGSALDASGVVVCGETFVALGSQAEVAGALARYSPTSSGWQGLTPVAAGASADRALALAFQSDGSIVAGGVGFPLAGAALVRFTPAGALDATFGTNGIVSQNTTAQSVKAVLVQPSGKVVVYDGSLHRYDATGKPDASFPSQSVTNGEFLLADATGNLIVGGGGSEFVLQRYSADGVPDGSFNATTAFNDAAVNTATRAIIQADGRFVVLGANGSASYLANTTRIVRFAQTGALDASFGGTGKITLTGAPLALAQQADGKFLAVTVPQYGGGPLTVSRFTADGAPDSTFATAGAFTMNVGGNDYARLETFGGLVIQSDGHVVLGYADSADGLNESAALLRLDTDGSPDTSFGPNGIKSLAAISSGSSAIYAMALDAGGKLVATGRAWSPATASDIFVLRLSL